MDVTSFFSGQSFVAPGPGHGWSIYQLKEAPLEIHVDIFEMKSNLWQKPGWCPESAALNGDFHEYPLSCVHQLRNIVSFEVPARLSERSASRFGSRGRFLRKVLP